MPCFEASGLGSTWQGEVDVHQHPFGAEGLSVTRSEFQLVSSCGKMEKEIPNRAMCNQSLKFFLSNFS